MQSSDFHSVLAPLERLLLRCLTKPELSMNCSAAASLKTEPIARRSGVFISDFANSLSTSAEVSVSRFFAKRLMITRANFCHAGFVDAALVFGDDVTLDEVTERLDNIDDGYFFPRPHRVVK